MLIKRVATALVLLPIVAWLLFATSLQVFTLGFSLVMLIAGWEWTRLMGLSRYPARFLYLFLLQILMIATLWLAPDLVFWPGAPKPQTISQWLNIRYLPLWILTVGGLWWVISLLSLIVGKANWLAGNKLLWARGVSGFLIILPSWVALISLRAIDILKDPLAGGWVLLFVMLQIWAADTGAYFSGRAFGKHQLAPAVSPKKTWEGVIGGTVLAIILAFLSAKPFNIEMSATSLLLTSIIIVIFSIVGDLTESIYKRQQQIKDSSHLLPGHGGILDRIDSITSAVPVFAVILYWMYR